VAGSFVKAIKLRPFNKRAMRLSIVAGLEEFAEIVQGDLEKTTRTWAEPVDFDIEITQTSKVLEGVKDVKITFETDDMRWIWTDEGTKPHIIKPKPSNKRGLLFFNSKFTPKTKPGSLRSGKGFSGPPKVSKAIVHHPGTKAREFSQQIKKKRALKFRQVMNAALKRGAEASGYKYQKRG